MQSIWSDLDLGLIFEGEESVQSYVLLLGKEISDGLSNVGYEYYDGNVMAYNPTWCLSEQVELVDAPDYPYVYSQ